MPDEEWDTPVIGAGVIGCATAYHVKRADPDRGVLLLDRNDRPAMGNTRRSVALFRDLFTSPTNRDLASSTIALFDHVGRDLGHDPGLRRYGYYWLMDGERIASLQGQLADLEREGLDLEVHDRDGVVARMGQGQGPGQGLVLEPGAPEGRGPMAPVDGAVLARNAGTLSPTRLARWFEGEFRAMGGEVRYGLLPSTGVYLKPIRSRRMLLAGCADTFGRPYRLADAPRPEPGLLDRQIRPVLEAYLPAMRGAGARVGWAGQYHYNTVDGNPYVFRAANLTVVAGASGSGIMKSDAIGRVAAAVHMGEREAELFDGRRVDVTHLGVMSRRVEPEDLII